MFVSVFCRCLTPSSLQPLALPAVLALAISSPVFRHGLPALIWWCFCDVISVTVWVWLLPACPPYAWRNAWGGLVCALPTVRFSDAREIHRCRGIWYILVGRGRFAEVRGWFIRNQNSVRFLWEGIGWDDRLVLKKSEIGFRDCLALQCEKKATTECWCLCRHRVRTASGAHDKYLSPLLMPVGYVKGHWLVQMLQISCSYMFRG